MAVMTKTPAGDDIVILARAEYEAMLERIEDASDVAAAGAALGRIARGEEEVLTSDEVDALLAAPAPLAFWRKKRGLTQTDLAAQTGISQGYLSDLESGRRTGDVATLRRVARALRVTLDDLAPEE